MVYSNETWKLYEIGLTEDGFIKKQISDFSVFSDQVTAPYDGSGRVFFTEITKIYLN